MRLSAMPILLLALLALSGCQNSFDTPEHAYTTFQSKVKKGDFKEAYGALSQKTQKVLAERAEALKESSGGNVKVEPYELLFMNSAQPSDVTAPKVVRQEGDVATVVVLSSGQEHEVRLVHETSGWKIDLSESLKP